MEIRSCGATLSAYSFGGLGVHAVVYLEQFVTTCSANQTEVRLNQAMMSHQSKRTQLHVQGHTHTGLAWELSHALMHL